MERARYILMIMLLLMVGACANESAGEVCFKSDGTISPEPSATNNSGTLKDISDYIKDKKVISTIVKRIRTDLFGGNGQEGRTKDMFIAISEGIRPAVSAAFVLFVTFYGLGVVGGYVQANIGDATIRVAKIGFISVMAFEYADFQGFIEGFFIESRDQLIGYLLQSTSELFNSGTTSTAVANASSSGAEAVFQNLFAPLDDFMAKIFSPHMFAIAAALFDLLGQGSGPYAIGFALLLAVGLFSLFSAMMQVVIIYIFSLFANAILFAVAPIYLSFLLFEKTREMFESWLKQLVNYNLQPVLAALLLSLFIDLLGPFLNEILGLSVKNESGPQACGNGKQACWVFAQVGASGKCTMYNPSAASPQPIDLQTIILFVFFAWCFKAYIGITSSIAVALTNGGGDLSKLGDQLLSKVKQGFGR